MWCALLLTRSPSGNNDSIPEACELIRDEKMAALSGPFISLEGDMLEREDMSQSGLNWFSLAHLQLTWPDHPDRSARISGHCIPPGGDIRFYVIFCQCHKDLFRFRNKRGLFSTAICDRERHLDLITRIIESNHLTWDGIIVSPVSSFTPSFCTSTAWAT